MTTEIEPGTGNRQVSPISESGIPRLPCKVDNATKSSKVPDRVNHYWILETPNGATKSFGVCKRCGSGRFFPNAVEVRLDYDDEFGTDSPIDSNDSSPLD
ncbi:hypothetical protein A2164_01285 [Candidatus Curtissbacteria bacterium RBG_13_35_7]|uniref:Ig-like domain-containing protein n=1 Tax=Candidatus Curtissbacteria bacterium RBG_13_35_7 TaxID=1797705 RepID=A0A1F5G386_9BACT|nr:MAG: hypothetical protein A2164_01285 [Candidatus Curtissbacteria bacterium RBG_13_35_7]